MSAYYPKAVKLNNGKSGGSFLNAPYRIILHTTETAGLPGYDSGQASPHVTYDPKDRKFYQHTQFTGAARALRNVAGGVQTNRMRALQLEIICYSDKGVADQNPSRLWVGNLSAQAIEDITEFILWLCQTFGVKPEVRLPRPTPKYGTASPARMKADEWNSFNGIAGHFEVPENTHWDTGALNIKAIADEVKRRMSGDTSPIGDEEEMWSKDLDENMWRTLYRGGIAKSSSEAALIDYWWTKRAERTDAEHLRASRAMSRETALMWAQNANDVNNFRNELAGVGSNVNFVRWLIPWYRKWANFLPENFVKEGSGGSATDGVARQEAQRAHTRLDNLKNI